MTTDLENRLAYRFRNPLLLQEALRHSSFVNEQPDPGLRSNERMEFLGDAVLNLVIGHLLMERYPHLLEGELSRTRATLVNESGLAKIGRRLGLGDHLQLGRGERQTHGRKKKSILADALEAIVAAVYLDGGFDDARRIVDTLFSDRMAAVATRQVDGDHKSRLQVLVQTACGVVPEYRTVTESGPDHDKTFQVQLRVEGLTTLGEGKSKKAAEQDAARKALEHLADADEA
jgi:ribonuclease III